MEARFGVAPYQAEDDDEDEDDDNDDEDLPAAQTTNRGGLLGGNEFHACEKQ